VGGDGLTRARGLHEHRGRHLRTASELRGIIGQHPELVASATRSSTLRSARAPSGEVDIFHVNDYLAKHAGG
jgi:hypothetical protein